jgi:hypothetical protein
MPLYDFYNPETDEQWEAKMSYEEMKQFVADNPHLQQVFSMNIVGGTGSGGIKTDDGFKEVMSRIAEANPYSPLAKEYGAKDSLSVKKRNAVDKVRKKIGGALG